MATGARLVWTTTSCPSFPVWNFLASAILGIITNTTTRTNNRFTAVSLLKASMVEGGNMQRWFYCRQEEGTHHNGCEPLWNVWAVSII
jgi:hypothetical protein